MKFNRVFFFFNKTFPFVSWTSIYAIFMFSCKKIDISFWSELWNGQTLRHYCTKFTVVICFKKIIFRFFLGPLYVLSKSFNAKNTVLALWSKFFTGNTSKKNFPFVSWTSIYAIYKFSCKKHRHYIPVRIVERSNLGALSYEMKPVFYFLFFFKNNFPFISWTFVYAFLKF